MNKPGDTIDYGEDAGGGFPTPRPPSGADAVLLRQEAYWLSTQRTPIGAIESPAERGRKRKEYQERHREFIQEMVARRGLLDGHTFDDGLRVRFVARDPGQRNIVLNLTIVFSKV